MSETIGVLALARSTFDVPFAEEVAAKAFAAIDRAGIKTAGTPSLLFDTPAAEAALADIEAAGAKRLLLLQVTFTDAAMTVELSKAFDAPLAIWAFPEPRLGGRLRLNSFCGLNLALHALGRAGKSATYLYSAPDAPNVQAAVRELLSAEPGVRDGGSIPWPWSQPAPDDIARAKAKVKALNGMHIGLVGQHPAGFDTCRFDDAAIAELAGVGVLRVGLGDVFERARQVRPERVMTALDRVSGFSGIREVDRPQLDRSMRVYEALEEIALEKGCDALAVRCWPEMFTEYGCAACGPMGLLNGRGMPAACEADVYGALTQRLLQDIAGEPAWLVDIVDMDAASDTGVLWHCGSAPLSMCDPEDRPMAQIHSNRKMPLLAEFALKPGRITIARISQARNETKMIIGGGEVVRAPKSFTGTSAVVRFDGGTERAMHALLGMALEHHVAIVYGEHRAAMAAAGRELGIDVVGLQ